MRTLISTALILSPLVVHADAPAVTLDAAAIAKTVLCTDGKKHFVAIAPDADHGQKLYSGDAASMSAVESFAGNALGPTSFLEPRYPNPTYNSDFRGLDMRIYSEVAYDADKSTCALRCGERTVPLTIVPAADAKRTLEKTTFHPTIRTREPHALARDDRGTYYYVERGIGEAGKNNFRVFVGKKGAMKLQKMKDVASDSEGEVFSTTTGDLRLVTSHDRKEYTWIQGKKPTTLIALPPYENMTLIYTTLGIYTGQRFGTPCDDM